MVGVTPHYQNRYNNVDTARQALVDAVREERLHVLMDMLEYRDPLWAAYAEEWARDTAFVPSNYDADGHLLDMSEEEWERVTRQYAVNVVVDAFDRLVREDNKRDLATLRIQGSWYWVSGEMSWGDVNNESLNAIWLLNNFESVFNPPKFSPEMMIEQLREWSNSLEKGMVHQPGVIAGLRQVADDMEVEMEMKDGARLMLMDVRSVDVEQYGKTAVVAVDGAHVYLRTPVHLAGTKLPHGPDFYALRELDSASELEVK